MSNGISSEEDLTLVRQLESVDGEVMVLIDQLKGLAALLTKADFHSVIESDEHRGIGLIIESFGISAEKIHNEMNKLVKQEMKNRRV